MINSSPLKKSALISPLAGASRLKPGAGRHRRTMVASLMLTSLVDAFSILVIFLIMNHSANQEVVNVGDKVELPQARETELIQQGVVVRIENGRYMVDEKAVGLGSLAGQLKKLNQEADTEAKKDGLIIVADRKLDYEALSPVILAGSNAGFTKFKFAVIKN